MSKIHNLYKQYIHIKKFENEKIYILNTHMKHQTWITTGNDKTIYYQ